MKMEYPLSSRALFGRKYLDLQERRRELSAPREDYVLVKVRACGVCGTDLNFVRDWKDEPQPLGHEIAAEVLEAGGGAAGFKPGDRVIVEDCTMCGTCPDCKSGHPELCRNLFNLEGQPGMGEYLIVRHNSLVKFEGLDWAPASLTEPLAVCLTAVSNAQVPLGGSVLVLGNGPLGLMTARLARLRGARWVGITGLAADTPRERARFAAAAKLGCDLAIRVGRDDVERELKSRFPSGVDRVIVSSPPESLPDALKVIRFGGIVSFFGLHFGGRSKVSVDVNELVFRKISLIPTFAEPAINFPMANRLLRDGLVDAGVLVTHTFGFDQAADTLRGMVEGGLPAIKAVMLPHGE
jgi:L-iditol 2-dehydrogenase